MNRFTFTVAFGDAAFKDHERLRATWIDVLGRVVGTEDANLVFLIFETLDGATTRIHFAGQVAFLSSFGEHREVERLLTARALATCAGVLASEDPDSVLSIVSWTLSVDRLTRVACRLRDHANAPTPIKDTTP